MEHLILKTIENSKNEIIRFCQKLVKIPSQNGIDNEEKVARAVSSKLRRLGINHKLIGNNEKRPSIIATIGRKSKKSFILNAHLDTVPVGDKNKWKYSPFSGKIINGKLYGRGSADCKAGIAAIIYAAHALSNLKLNGQLILAFDSDEELPSYTGMKELLDKGLRGDSFLIAYPGNDEIMIGSRGVMRLVITTLGKTAHAGSRWKKGINAINEMCKIIKILQTLNLKHKKDPYFPFGPKLTVSKIEGGTAFNVVPDKCSIEVDIRTLPSQTKQGVLRQIKNALKTNIPESRFSVKEMGYVPARRMSGNEKIIKILLKRAEQILKNKPRIACSGPTNSSKLLEEKGIHGICGFGADFKNTHSYNECIYTDSLIDTTKIYALTAFDFLK